MKPRFVAWALYLALVEQALRHPDPVSGRTGKLVGEEVAVLNTKAGQDDFALVRPAIAVCIGEEYEVVPVEDVNGATITPRQDAKGHRKAVRKDGWIAQAALGNVGEGLPGENEHLVLCMPFIERLRGGGILIGIHGVLERGLCPQSTSLIKVHGDKLPDAIRFLEDEFDLVPFG